MKSLLLFALIAYVVLGIFLYLQQRSFIYFPVPENKTGLDTQWFESEGHRIKVTVLRPQKSINKDSDNNGSKAILYFGGNAESVEYNAEDFLKVFPEYTSYLVHYRGYGGSSGAPTEQAMYADALAIYDKLEFEHQSIAVIGRSLGSSVATYTAANRRVKKLVLVTPFDSVLSVAQSQYPIYPVSLMLKDKHDSLSRTSKIQASTLVLAAEFDRVIKLKHTQSLLKGFRGDVSFHILNGVGHNDIAVNPEYYQLLSEFL